MYHPKTWQQISFYNIIRGVSCLKVLKIFFYQTKTFIFKVDLKINEIRLDCERLVGSCWPCCLPPPELSFPSRRPGGEGTTRSDWLPRWGQTQFSAARSRSASEKGRNGRASCYRAGQNRSTLASRTDRDTLNGPKPSSSPQTVPVKAAPTRERRPTALHRSTVS